MSYLHSAFAWVAVLCFLVASSLLAADKKPAAARPHYETGQAAIEKALAAPVDLDFTDTPLDDVVDYLKNRCKIEIVVDSKALAEVGIGGVTPITTKLHNLPLRSALNLMLREFGEFGMIWTIRDDVLLITTPEQAENCLLTKVYDVSDLVVCRGEHDELWDDYVTLIDAISSTVMPTTWDDVGGPGSASGVSLGKAKVLIVLQTYDVHCRVAELLASIRDVAKKNPDGQLPRRNKPLPVPPTERVWFGLRLPGDPPSSPSATSSKPAPDAGRGPRKELRPVDGKRTTLGEPKPPLSNDDSSNPFDSLK